MFLPVAPVSKARRPRRWLRRFMYVVLSLLALWLIAVQAGCFAMRTPDRDWPGKMKNRGQTLAPVFFDVPASGRNVHAAAVGSADSLPLIVWVHGSPGSADAFLAYLADTALTRVARLVALDRPGFGYTSGFGRAESSMAAQAAAVAAVADRLSPGRPVWLVGHSLGGPVIARFAMDYPERTAGLVLVAASIDPDQEKHPWWQAFFNRRPGCWLLPKSFYASNREIADLEAELRQMLPRWGEIRCPVRVIHATNDRLVPLANATFAREQLVNCPDLQSTILPSGDHFFLWTRPEVVRRVVLDLMEN